MLMFAGTLLALAIGVLPARPWRAPRVAPLLLVGWPGVLPAAVVMAAILLGEATLVVDWLGRVLERTDPAQVEIAE